MAEAAPPAPAGVINLVEEAPAAPTFVVNNKRYTLQAALAKLRDLKRVSRKPWWSSFQICASEEGDKAEPRLKCVNCNALLTVSNPAQTASTHLTQRACKGLRRIATADAAAADASAPAAAGGSSSGAAAAASRSSGGGSSSGAAGASSSSSGGGALASVLGKRSRGGCLYATADQQQKFERCLARWFFKNGIPLQLTDDPDLKAAVGHVGLLPPSRHDLSNKLLDEAYDEVRAADKVKLAGQQLQLTTDGWRRRTAVRGVPLINVMALLAAGGSVFFKVVAAPGVVKDKDWIKEKHLEWASMVTEGDLGRLVGMVMDNTKANMYVTSSASTPFKS
jgi:hypothetical protein